MQSPRSDSLWQRANSVLVGGVNSPVRAFAGVGGTPFFVESAQGARLRTTDGATLIDYVLSWGPLALGHAYPRVVEAVKTAMERGSSFGIPTEAEVELAELIVRLVPSIEKVRLVNSGTEAAMSVIRLARGFTGRDLILKMQGCYHGHVDGLLVEAGSGPATLGTPSSPGVPAAYTECTLTAPFNNLESVRAAFDAYPDRIACVIIEPVAGNMGVVLPQEGYLQGLRDVTRQHGALLVFDEVMSGFRASLGGAQERFGVTPDLTMLGKVIGGGLPVGAYGGPAHIMDNLAPVGQVYQAGTLSGNPLATAAGIATLSALAEPGVFEEIESRLTTLLSGLQGRAEVAGVPVCTAQAGSMGGMFFQQGPVADYAGAKQSDTDRYAKFFHAMLDGGVYIAPSQFEALFMSAAHTDADIEQTLDVAEKAFAAL